MILHHYTSTQNLASIFRTGLDTGTVPLGNDRFMTGCVWLSSLGTDDTTVPAVDSMACITIDFPRTLSRRLVHWPVHARKHGLRVDAGGNAKPDTIYFHRGPIRPDRLLSVRLLSGQVVDQSDYIGQPIVRPDAPERPDWASFVDWRGVAVPA